MILPRRWVSRGGDAGVLQNCFLTWLFFVFIAQTSIGASPHSYTPPTLDTPDLCIWGTLLGFETFFFLRLHQDKIELILNTEFILCSKNGVVDK
jgi:hypothetical protein